MKVEVAKSCLTLRDPMDCSTPGFPVLHYFPDSSAGKESACSAADPGSIPGLGRSPREGVGYAH